MPGLTCGLTSRMIAGSNYLSRGVLRPAVGVAPRGDKTQSYNSVTSTKAVTTVTFSILFHRNHVNVSASEVAHFVYRFKPLRANNVQSRLKVIEDSLATGDFLKEQIICVLQEFQILSEESNVGALVKFHIEEAVRAATGNQTLAEQFGHLVPKQ